MTEKESYRSFIKIAGILSILSATGFIGTMLTNFGLGDRLVYGWFGLFGTITFVPSMCGLYLYQQDDAKKDYLILGIILMFVGAVFVAGIYLAAMTSAVTTVYYSDFNNQAVMEAFDAFFRVFNGVTIIIGSFLTYGIAPLLLGLSARSSSTMPQWVAWIAIIGGIAGFAWLGFGWLLPFNFLIFAPSALLITLWQYVIGVHMFRWKTS